MPTSDTTKLPERWMIGLASWVLQDGNYTEFKTGQRRQFALELHYDRNNRLVQTDGHGRRCHYTGSATHYDVTAHVQLDAGQTRQRLFVLDFGLLAYSKWIVLDDLEPPPVGVWLNGSISLSVDPFDYMDSRFRPNGVPALIYTWTIEGIERNTTPPMRVERGHPLYVGPNEGSRLVPDPSKESWEAVTSTPIWDDAFYRLHCSLDPGPATDTMTASGSQTPYGPLRR